MPSYSPRFSFMESAADQKKVEKMWADRLHLNAVNEAKLSQENQELRQQLKTMAEVNEAGILTDDNGDCIHNLKAENKAIRKENADIVAYHKKCGVQCSQEIFDRMIDTIKELKEENEKLKEEVEEWKEVGDDYGQELYTPSDLHHYLSATIHEDEELYSKYMEPISLREENKKLIGQIGEFADFMADHEDFIFKKITGESPEDYDLTDK